MILAGLRGVDVHRFDASPASPSCLPYEIWRTIVRYLPQRTQWEVRAVDRTAYNVVMDEAFRWTRMTNLGGWETERNIRLLMYALFLVFPCLHDFDRFFHHSSGYPVLSSGFVASQSITKCCWHRLSIERHSFKEISSSPMHYGRRVTTGGTTMLTHDAHSMPHRTSSIPSPSWTVYAQWKLLALAIIGFLAPNGHLIFLDSDTYALRFSYPVPLSPDFRYISPRPTP